MSLINDALKRASQAQRSQRARRIPDAILTPVEEGVQPAVPPPPPTPGGMSPAFWRVFLAIGLFGSSMLVVLERWVVKEEAQELTVAKGKNRRGAGKNAATNLVATKVIATNTPPGTNAAVVPPPKQLAAVTSPAIVIVTDNNPPVKPPVPSVAAGTNPPVQPLKPVEVVKTSDPPTPWAVTNDVAIADILPTTNSTAVGPTQQPKATHQVAAGSVEIQRPFPRLKLQGIFSSTKKPLALINNQHFTIGDTIEEARVIRIEKASVVFEFFGRTNEVWLLR
jgi:hypothetical protein